MVPRRATQSKPVHLRRKTVRATATKAKNRKNTPRSKHLHKSLLTRSNVDRFRRILLDKRSELLSDMSRMEAEALRPNHDGNDGSPSRLLTHCANLGSDNYQRECTLGLLEKERTLLREIDEALNLIEDGKYGLCQATGKPISRARLTAKPWARYCIEYAQMNENEKGIGRRR